MKYKLVRASVKSAIVQSNCKPAPISEDFHLSSPHLLDLNPEQLAAVRHGAGPLIVFAGAGSGKTRVLTRRIANLVLEHGVSPQQILAVTFTNKAAREMKERVAQLFFDSQRYRNGSTGDAGGEHQSAPGQNGLGHHSEIHLGSSFWVSTFHSTCVRILRRHAPLLGYTSGFAIYDKSDSQSLLKKILKRQDIDPKTLDVRLVASYIDRAKNNYDCPDTMRQKSSGSGRYSYELDAQLAADVYEQYQQELRTANAMDFGDLLCNVLTLFKLEPAVLKRYQNQFQHILVDEYQDTNRVQYMLIRSLAGDKGNLCVVGDDDQSIYAFRGASIENILNFKKDYPGAKAITLNRNYRSTEMILSAANAIIAKNKQREKKTMRTDNPRGSGIIICSTFDERDEARFVAEQIRTSIADRNSEGAPGTIAVFYRTNAQSRAIEEAFGAYSIPYQIFGGHRFYDRKEIKDVLGYFRLLLNQNDNEAFLRVVNTPARGIGATTVAQLAAYAAERDLALFPALDEAIKTKPRGFSPAVLKKFAGFRDLISGLAENAQHAELALAQERGGSAISTESDSRFAIAELLQKIAEKTDYLGRLQDSNPEEAESRTENVLELYSVAVEFVVSSFQQGHVPSLCEFLDRASLSTDLEQENTKSTGASRTSVSLMTLHLAKGLEFDTVFMVGLEEGLLPHSRSLKEFAALEEERRLCYVGITRARKKLYLSYALHRTSFGRKNVYGECPSRFLDEVPGDCVEWVEGGSNW